MWYRNQKDKDTGEEEKKDSKRYNQIEQTVKSQTTGKDESGLDTVSLMGSGDCDTTQPFLVPLSLLTSVFSFPYLGQKNGSVPYRRFLYFIYIWIPFFFSENPLRCLNWILRSSVSIPIVIPGYRSTSPSPTCFFMTCR